MTGRMPSTLPGKLSLGCDALALCSTAPLPAADRPALPRPSTRRTRKDSP